MADWNDLVANLNTWKRGDERAVRKPLLTLMLLARAQRGGSNEVPYAEVHEQLRSALREFGPPRKTFQPEYPFWHLQNDGFWVLRDVESIPRRKGKDQATHRALLEHEAVGVVPDALWRQLTLEPARIAELARAVLDGFWPDTYHADIAAALGIELSPRKAGSRRDAAFRQIVLVAYEKRCAVCGFDGRLGDRVVGLEAAHIQCKEWNGPDEVRNGLALCTLHHKLFDWGAIGLSRDLLINVSNELTGNDAVRDMILAYVKKPLRGPQKGEARPAPEFIDWHARYVFRGLPRAA